MPLFYFHQRSEGDFYEDPDGSDQPDLSAARQEALAAARDLWAEAIVKGHDLSDREFVIANECFEHTLVVPFTDALPETLRQRLLLT